MHVLAYVKTAACRKARQFLWLTYLLLAYHCGLYAAACTGEWDAHLPQVPELPTIYSIVHVHKVLGERYQHTDTEGDSKLNVDAASEHQNVMHMCAESGWCHCSRFVTASRLLPNTASHECRAPCVEHRYRSEARVMARVESCACLGGYCIAALGFGAGLYKKPKNKFACLRPGKYYTEFSLYRLVDD